MVKGSSLLSYVSVKLRMELALGLLKQKTETRVWLPTVNEEALAALHCTRILLQDLQEVFDHIVLLVPSLTNERHIQLLSDRSALEPLHASLVRYYYQLTDWCLLSLNSGVLSGLSYTRVKSVVCDGRKGIVDVELVRPSTAVPWGLLFNEQAHLIGVDIGLRTQEKAQTLHQLLLCSQEGATLLSVNNTKLTSGKNKTLDARGILQAVREQSTTGTTLSLQLKAEGFRDKLRLHPFQLAFLVPPQGAEGAAGQRASLWLQRLDARVSWALHFEESQLDYGTYGSFLQFKANKTVFKSISPEAREFLEYYTDRLRVLYVNGIEARDAAHAQSLLEGRECARIDIVVTPHPTQARQHSRSIDGTTGEALAAVTNIRNLTKNVKRAIKRQAKSVKEVKVLPTEVEAPLAEVEEVEGDPSPEEVEAIMKDMLTITEVPVEADPAVPQEDTDTRCVFDNKVELLACTEEEMVWNRPTTAIPWSLKFKVETNTEGITSVNLTGLPDTTNATLRQHPYVQLFSSNPSRWLLQSVNGKSVAKSAKTALKTITKVKRMRLRFV
ncbi:hypothetical protein AGDE_09176 [Angomonas deanei]|uniref:Uncharacterized protein n=1 Tax=Angomonas deanei TaxID=59799 RepID=A0A7G2C334_9TRYP|nr:hypothetical protein AGDE_09176 [Angomonas deanei]CAD2213925.1 hypothetical protein, conserved [Angomonas deanei]|eukprot:EPY31193.1 hypothetical protein AGDE_09176 [Angomonas deanei]